MACCAFAVFVLAQLLAPLVWCRERLFGPRRANVAAAWALPGGATLEQATPRTRTFAPRLRTTLLAAAGLELVVAIAVVSHLSAAPSAAGDASMWVQALEGAWCRGAGAASG